MDQKDQGLSQSDRHQRAFSLRSLLCLHPRRNDAAHDDTGSRWAEKRKTTSEHGSSEDLPFYSLQTPGMSVASSQQAVVVGGLEVHVYGLDELRGSGATTTDVVFAMHGRTGAYGDLEPYVQSILAQESQTNRGLIVVSFDQRNHGHRLVSGEKNLSWDEGNATHAQDMYSIQSGTSDDVSFLITFLPSFIFPNGECTFANIIATGVSLGGHSTYLAASHDDRIAAAVPILGCPDYQALMTHRARGDKSRLPQTFLNVVAHRDPTVKSLSKRDLLVLRGAADDLVPWSASQPFIDRLPAGRKQVIAYPGVGHEFTQDMMKKAVTWIAEWRSRRK